MTNETMKLVPVVNLDAEASRNDDGSYHVIVRRDDGRHLKGKSEYLSVLPSGWTYKTESCSHSGDTASFTAIPEAE